MSQSVIGVCEVIPGISRRAGGPSSFLSDLSFQLPADSFRFAILTEGPPTRDDVALDDRIELHRVTTSLPRPYKLFHPPHSHSFDAIARRMPLGIVHSHGLWRNISRLAAKWARSHAVPLVISPHGTLEPWALAHKAFKKRLALIAYQRRDLANAIAFHACSDKEADAIRRFGLKQPIATIPNGTVLPPQNVLARHANGETKTALFLSRLHPVKGLPMLLEAWRDVAPRDWKLVIAGTDDAGCGPELARRAQEMGIAAEVEFTGPLFENDKSLAIAQADFFVLPSYSENFGIVVAEALSHGVPVLTTTGCPWRELETFQCGWWVAPTVSGIRDGLAKAFAATSESRRQMGLRGRRLIEERYQWPAIAEKFRQFYRWLIDGGAQPDFVS